MKFRGLRSGLFLIWMSIFIAQASNATVNITTSRIQYDCNGSTTVFAYPFKVYEDDDLGVLKADSSGNETTLVLNTDYTVSDAGDDAGGNITLTAGSVCGSGYTLTMLRDIDITQSTDFVDGQRVSASSLEAPPDKSRIIDQQFNEILSRSLRLPGSENGSVDLRTLPKLSDRASKFLAFNAEGEPIGSSGVPSGSVPVSSYMETVLDDTDAFEAVGTLKSSYVVATKAQAAALTLTSTDANRKIFITSSDCGEFTVEYNVTPGTYSDDGGSYCGTVFIPSGGDGTIGIVRDYSSAVDTKWFGALPSATAAINVTGINNALLLGGVIEISNLGIYLTDGALTPVSDSVFIIPAGVTIKHDTNVATNTRIISVASKTNVTITGGGKLDGNRTNQTNLGGIGVHITGGSDITVESLDIVDTTDKLVHVQSGCTDYVIKGIVGGSIQQGETGLRADEGCDNGLFAENIISNMGTDGSSQFGDGIYIGASFCTISNNRVSGVNRIGIVLENNGTDNVVKGNILIDNGVDATNPPAGIWVEQGGRSLISHNLIDQTNVAVANYGISMVQDDIVIANNIVKGGTNTSAGIRVVGSHVVVDGNYVSDVPNDGIRLSQTGTQEQVIVSNNVIKNTRRAIRAFSDQQFMTITGNHISDFPTGDVAGIELSTGSITFEDSIISNNIVDGPIADASGIRDAFQFKNLSRCIISDNIVRSAEDIGIAVTGTGGDNTISGNRVSNCGTNWSVTTDSMGSNNTGGLDGTVKTFGSGDATPSVLDYRDFQTSGTTTITDFDDGVLGQIIIIRMDGGGSLTIQHNGSIIDLNGSADFVMVNSNMLTLSMLTAGTWYEIGRSI